MAWQYFEVDAYVPPGDGATPALASEEAIDPVPANAAGSARDTGKIARTARTATTERLAAMLFRRTGVAPVSNLEIEYRDRRDACPTLVAESGIHTRSDVERLKQCGASAILVGESLMRGGDIKSKVRELIG